MSNPLSLSFFMSVLYYIVLIYLFLVNIITFSIRGIDKWKAENKKWRTKEKTLLIWTSIGGFLGALIGMTAFHHKTIKGKFLRQFMLISFGWLLAVVAALYFLRI